MNIFLNVQSNHVDNNLNLNMLMKNRIKVYGVGLDH